MLKVGITGGVGSGKTLICRVFEQLGINVYYADTVATGIFYRQDIQHKLILAFGTDVLDDSGTVNRKKLASLVFTDKKLLDKLNGIIHPAVAEDTERWTGAHSDSVYVLKEAAILFESGTFTGLDKIITVCSPLEMRYDRMLKREGWKREETELRMKNQWTDEEKIKRSDFVIYNDEQQLILPQVLAIHSNLLAIR